MTRSNFKAAYIPGNVREFFGLGYKEIAPQYQQIFKQEQQKYDVEKDIECYGFELPQQYEETDTIEFTSAGQGKPILYTVNKWAVGFQESFESRLSLQYQEIQAGKARSAGRVMRLAKEKNAAAIFDNAFTNTLQIDSLSLCNTAHLLPASSNTWSNRAALDADPSEELIKEACKTIWAMPDSRGERMMVQPKAIVAHKNQMFTFSELLKSEYKVNTDLNNKNPLISSGAVPLNVIYLDFIDTSSNQWFMLTDQDGFLLKQQVPLRMGSQETFATMGGMEHYFMEMYAFYCERPRSVWGSSGA